jgi:hypothetical protein
MEENKIITCNTDDGWTEKNEELLFQLLSETKAKFILSTWHHSDWRKNDMISKYWSKFNILTKDHFYHNGGNVENRKSVVEALVCNFDTSKYHTHNHSLKEKSEVTQLGLQWMNETITMLLTSRQARKRTVPLQTENSDNSMNVTKI